MKRQLLHTINPVPRIPWRHARSPSEIFCVIVFPTSVASVERRFTNSPVPVLSKNPASCRKIDVNNENLSLLTILLPKETKMFRNKMIVN